ncbi:hypothetical protein OROHE_003686 [Orobanche hederae]
MRNGREGKESPVDCDVGLGLKMQLQPTESYSCDGGGALFSNTSNQCVGDIYHTANSIFLSRSFQNTAFRASGGSMSMSGKALFTESQWQELERQNMIHKYIMAAVPIPPQLLLPTSTALSSLSLCNTSGLDLRFPSSGSDPEPWRCKRTDGKKWRCSRDVAPDQKYCERHAHKSKPRSRKHVEVSSHATNYSHQSLVLPANTNQRSSSQSPTMASLTSYDQTRCFEWFMRGGSTSNTTSTVSTSSRQQLRQQQVMQIASSSPPRFELDKDNTDHNKNASSYNQPQNYDDDKQGFYIPDTSNLQMSENHHHQEMDSSHRTQTTRHFFTDAWDKDIGFDVGINRKGLSASLSKKFSPSALSLSMSGGGSNSGIGHEDDDEDGYLGIGVTDSTVSWMNTISLPGGPLGEALCLGNPSATRGGKSASPHGYSNSNTNSSTCSKSSCDDGSRALNFIG